MAEITILDLNFQGVPNSIASYLVETREGPVLVETGPHSCLADLQAGLSKKGYEMQDVKHVFLTHIHLDHAGAAWAFAEKGAKIYVHPKGHPHLASPEKLMASATMIYGEDMDTLWGQMKPIDDAQLIAVEDETTIEVYGVRLIAHHTPGHAKHHIAWQLHDVIFTGDVAGVKIGNGPVMPPCPPPDIQIEDWLESIDRIKRIAPAALLLTHFGEIVKVTSHFDELKAVLSDWANWIKPYFESGTDPKIITPKFQLYVKEQLLNAKMGPESIEQYEKANPSWMSVAGLLRYWKLKEDTQVKD